MHRAVQAIGAHDLKVKLDLYHRQIVESELAMTIRQYLPTSCFAHFQIAEVPTPHQPDCGELKTPNRSKSPPTVAGKAGLATNCGLRVARRTLDGLGRSFGAEMLTRMLR